MTLRILSFIGMEKMAVKLRRIESSSLVLDVLSLRCLLNAHVEIEQMYSWGHLMKAGMQLRNVTSPRESAV